MLTWHYITSEVYNAAGPEQKTSDKLFYLSDTRQIYRGTDLFTEACRLYDTTEPATPAVGVLYIEQNTLEGKIYNGAAWQTVIQPIQTTVDAGNTNKPVSGKAVADYVTSAIAEAASDASEALNGASYDAGTNTITFTRNSGEDPVAVKITDLPCDLKYNSDTGLLQLADEGGSAIGTGINLDLERFVKSGEYDPETKVITLYFNDEKTDKVEIDAAALVDIYTGGTTGTATVAVSGGNEITVNVKVSGTAGNQLTTDDQGLFVAAPDLSGKMDKDTDAVQDNLAKFDASGNAIDAGIKAGGATLSANDATTLATEAAVEAIRAALQTAVDGKVSKMVGATADNLVAATSDGQVKDSGFKAGTGTMTGDAKTLATEAGVQAAIDALNIGNKMDKDTDAVAGNFAKFEAGGNAVDAGVVMGGATLADSPVATTIASEAAVAAALTWKTSI